MHKKKSYSHRLRIALFYPATAARISGHFTLSVEAKGASRSGVPMTCDSERAASAFILSSYAF
ncbi:hypothetical protein COE89_16085 [Bacillus wiedmannii]|uniref:Uncharacterized protein n=1 Tax=Bacillus wiedmannii TaxID=1890302 RepID=A0AB73RB31_9BACI|nr:hypothetical protein CN694_24135 [Bacillus wiedmannii]PHB71586.1 hypothetical protein COE89_16085 [Bacillus wiedmannii]